MYDYDLWENSECTALFSPQKVRYLKIIEKSGYQALPWVRYITQNGGRSRVQHQGAQMCRCALGNSWAI